ncbi:hypothetical protein L7F22_030563 [Adiantum nelumboides]|nr:hypothetical protein [Adiantum nelumboides]
MASNASTSSGEPKSLMEIKRFDDTGFDLWKERMQAILIFKDCEDALLVAKPENLSDEVSERLNKKAIAYIKMAVTDDVLTDIKRLPTAYAVWEKLTSSYENRTSVNQVHLMRKLVNMKLHEAKPASKHLNAFTGVLSQLQDSGLQPFDDNYTNNAALTYDGVRGSILNEEIRRKSSGEGSGTAYHVRGRTEKRNHVANKGKSRSKSKGKSQDITCYQCGRKGHKKPDCRFYKQELERKKQQQGKKKKDAKDAKGVVPSTWVQFKQIFAPAWITNTFEVDVMTAWNRLSAINCESLEEYNAKFWDALLPVSSFKMVPLAEQIEKYCCGLPKGIKKYCTKTSVMNMAQLMENAEFLIQGKLDEDGFKTRCKEPQGRQFSAKGNVTSRLTVPPFKKKPFAGSKPFAGNRPFNSGNRPNAENQQFRPPPFSGQRQGFKRHFTGKTIEEHKALRDANKCYICEGHFANECPQRNSQYKDDKSDREGKKPKPSAGLVPDLVDDQQNVDATELWRACVIKSNI